MCGKPKTATATQFHNHIMSSGLRRRIVKMAAIVDIIDFVVSDIIISHFLVNYL